MISGKELSRPRRLLAGGGQWGSVLVMLELLLATAGVNCAGLAAGLIGDLTVIRAGDGENIYNRTDDLFKYRFFFF